MNDRPGGDRKQNRQGYFFTLLSMPLYRTEKLLFPHTGNKELFRQDIYRIRMILCVCGRLFRIYPIISIPRCRVSASIAPVACAIAYPSASMKYVVGREYTP